MSLNNGKTKRIAVVTKMREFHQEVFLVWLRADHEGIMSEVLRSTKEMKWCKDVLSKKREQAYLSNHHKVLCFHGVGAERCGNVFTAVVRQTNTSRV